MPASVQGDLVSPVMPVDVAVVSVKYGADCERTLFDEPPMVDEWQPDPRRAQITAVALYAGRPFAFVSSSHPDEQLTLENVDGMQLSRWGLRRRSPGPASVCSTA